jgi:tungstate transport system substrate-binding protein
MGRKMHLLVFVVASLVLGALCTGCEQPENVKMATTTSTDNSGLLDVLLPAFTEKCGIKVEVIAVGTGRAIKHGENGDVDLILVHAREAEDKFVADGFGVNRRNVMHNDFVITGPAADPAGIRGIKDATEALRKIAQSKSFFISRGDDSGTHKKEKQLWRTAGVTPGGDWYLSAGQGMGAVLTIANEKQAYTLTDRGTYIAMKSKLQLPVLVEGDERLHNPYGVIAVNPAKHPHVKYAAAMKFIEWLTSREAQDIIRNFRKEGEVLFYPDAIAQK